MFGVQLTVNWHLYPVSSPFRESGKKKRKRGDGGSSNANVYVTRSVVSGGRRREGSVKRLRR